MEVDKKSDDEWLIADPVPLTETEMVGTFLQDQEKKDRELYVFLTQEDANMETVKDTLSELTEHIHRLSVGDFQADVAGPQTDGPKRVEVEPARWWLLPPYLLPWTLPTYLVDSPYKK